MNKRWVTGVAAAAIMLGIFYFVNSSFSKNQDDAPVEGSRLPGLLVGDAPWRANQDQLYERLRLIRLPALSSEGTALHTHQHIAIIIHGRAVKVPADIGRDLNQQFTAPIHTHDLSAIIHVESPTRERYTLGQFFDIWGVRFSNDCLGGYCRDAKDQLNVYSNGQLATGDIRDVELTDHQEIVVAYGLATELPDPAPSAFALPSGY